MSFHHHYNNLFLRNLAEAARETQTATDKYDVRIVRAVKVTDDEPYWRMIGVHHLLPDENQGNHHVFLEALDEKGNRVREPIIEVEWGWEGMHDGEKPAPARLDKSDNDPAADIAIDRVGQRVWLQVKGAKSDRVENLHTDHGWEKRTNSEENGSYEGHHSFYVVFQRTSGAGLGTSPGTGEVSEPIIEPPPERSALEAALWEAGDPHLIPLNREAALYKFAQQHNLGERLTDEYSLEPAFDIAPTLPWPLVTDGFDFPVGRPHGQGYYVAASFLDPTYYADEGFWHSSEDWNGLGGGDTDLGAPVYAVANGQVVTAHFFPVWGNVILIEHVLPSGKKVWSQYAHLQDRFVGKDEIVQRGQQIGAIGKGEGIRYLAHLHFEIRLKSMPASQWGWSRPEDRQAVLQAYAHPTNFINGHRPNF